MDNRVLYIGGFELPDKNAAASRVFANAMLLHDMGYDVSFIGVSKDINNAPSQVYEFKSTPVEYPTTIIQWIHQIFTFIDFEVINEYDPNYVVLYNFPSVASLKIVRKCHKRGIKVIHDLTEWEEARGWRPRDFLRKIDIFLRMRYCIKKMDGVIAISRYLYDYCRGFTKCILVPPTVNLEDPKFCRERSLEKRDECIKLVYAGCAGAGSAKDRLDIIIHAVEKYPNIRLDILGLEKEQYNFDFKDNLSNIGNICFHGRVTHQDAVMAVCGADFQMLIREDTLKNKAGFPTKFVESISCCTPIIATKTSNICDYLEDGENGFLVTEDKSLDTVLKIIMGLSPAEISRMKHNCRNCRCFDYRFYKQDFLELFN